MKASPTVILLFIYLLIFVSGQSMTQTGQQTINIVDTSGSRTQTINFPQTFSASPSVGVALTGFQQANAGATGVHATVSTVSTTGFTVVVTYDTTLPITAVQISYIATISAQSGIYISTSSISSSEPDVKTSAGEYRRPVTIPAGITTPKILPYIRGFAYQAPYNTRLHLYIDTSNNLVYNPWDNSIFLGADVTLIIYDASDFTIWSNNFGPGGDVHSSSSSTPITTSY